MANKDKSLNLSKLLRSLHTDQNLRRQGVLTAPLPPQMALLRAWQTQRLTGTYGDFLQDPPHAAACQFFLTDIYAARDFSQRDHDLERIHLLLQRFLPDHMLSLLSLVVSLNRMTAALDEALLKALVDDLGVTDTITPELYAQGYRICDNYAQRVEQIEILVQVTRQAAVGALHPLVYPTLRAARFPAEKAGWSEFWDYLWRSYLAFKPMRGGKTFASAIAAREQAILDRIFAGAANPFTEE